MAGVIYSIFVGLIVVCGLAVVAMLLVPFYVLGYRLIRGKWPGRRRFYID